MNKHNILFAIIGLLAGFIIGFIFANQTNRSAVDNSRPAEMRTPRPGTPPTGEAGTQTGTGNKPATPTEAEIRDAITKADARPEDASLQRGFGMVLYRYANQTQNASFLPDVARMLKRAYEKNPNDRELIVALGNVYFDMGQASDPVHFAESREYYLKALEIKADDVNVRTDLGLTCYFGQPSDPQRAIAEYRKSLALDSRHEQTLQNIATALIAVGKTDEAQKFIDQLSGINPTNPSLPDLRAQMAQSKNRSPE